jgi:hypothetical protein
LKKGSDKYKGELSFKCFNCSKVGHLSAKCSHKTNNEEEIGFKTNKRYHKNSKNNEKIKHYKKKINLYANDESSSSDEDDNSSEDVLFMAINYQYEL